MTACKSQGYTGVCFSGTTFVQKPSHHTSFSGGYSKQSWSIISRYLVDVNTISSPCEQMLVLSFPEDLIRPENRPRVRPLSLGNVNLYFSSHRERKKKTSPSYRMRFSATGCPWSECKFQVIWVEILRYFQPSWSLLSKSFGFLDPLRIRLIDYRYMCTVREHTTAFQSQVQRRAVCFFFFINHRQAASAPVKHSGRCQLLFRVVPLSYCALFCSIFSLRIVYWDRVEEVGWGKQLSRNPWTNVVKLCIGTFSTSLLSLST